MIEFDTVSKRYSFRAAPALDALSLEVPDGQTFGLIGPNGAGKTTAIRIAIGVMLPTSGTVRIDGEDLSKNKHRASAKIGWVSDGDIFDPRARATSVLRYLDGFYPGHRRMTLEEAEQRLEEVGLGLWSSKRVGTYSYGMKRRFALAAASVGDPSIYFLDEPYEGLDPGGQQFLRDWLGLRAKAGSTLIIATHRLGEVQKIADKVAILNLGKLVRLVDRTEFADQKVVTVRVGGSNLDEGAVELLRVVGEVTRVEEDLLVTGPSIDSSQIVELLFTHGYRVSQLTPEKKTLEIVYSETFSTSS